MTPRTGRAIVAPSHGPGLGMATLLGGVVREPAFQKQKCAWFPTLWIHCRLAFSQGANFFDSDRHTLVCQRSVRAVSW